MRTSAVVLLLLVAACTTQQEPAVTTTSPAPSTTVATTRPSTPASTSTTQADPTTTTTLAPLQRIEYAEVARLPFPVEMTARPGDDLAYVATKDGRIWVYDGSSIGDQPVLDISGSVRNQGEQGLLSIALHPSQPSLVYAHYSAGDGDTVLSEFRFSDESNIDRGSERVLLRLDQPAGNHNGGMIQFGPDGTLFLGLGDGGGANDTFNNGQNRDSLLGGIVAIDVDAGSAPVLYDYGLRNPWRFWIEGEMIYIADVGQNAFEEVSVTALQPDLNYGWPITEGLHCFRPSTGCDTTGLTLPVIEVEHGDAGTCSITGGIVYRGRDIPELDGTYFYSDYCGGYLRSFSFQDGEVTSETDWTDQVGVPGNIVGFGVDGEGEMYVATTDRLLKVVPIRG